MVFLAFTLRLPIQTSLSVAPELPDSWRSGEKCQKFQENKHTPELLEQTEPMKENESESRL